MTHEKYPTHVHCSSPSPKFPFVSLYDQPFSRYSTFQVFPLTPMLKLQSAIKILIWQIANIYHNVLFPHEYLICHKVWCRLDENRRRSSVLKLLLPQGPILTKTKKKIINIWKIENFEKSKKWSGDMVERELPTKFGRDPCGGF